MLSLGRDIIGELPPGPKRLDRSISPSRGMSGSQAAVMSTECLQLNILLLSGCPVTEVSIFCAFQSLAKRSAHSFKAVTDCPLLVGLYYCSESAALCQQSSPVTWCEAEGTESALKLPRVTSSGIPHRVMFPNSSLNDT